MKREHLQHIIRAASAICEEPDFIVIGSQAIHGSLSDIDEVELVRSMEADLYPVHAPNKSELLNTIGEFSPFHTQNGYYADGVDETTATLPAGWKDRVVCISGPLTQNVHGFEARGWCLELHDLVISKLVAGREKDIAFFRALVRMHELQEVTLRERLAQTELSPAKRRIVESQFGAAFEKSTGPQG
jgi:hypothetical protein